MKINSTGLSDGQTTTISTTTTTGMCQRLFSDWLCYALICVGAAVFMENLLIVATIWRGYSNSSVTANSYLFLASLAAVDALAGLSGIASATVYIKVYPETSHNIFPVSNLYSIVGIASMSTLVISVFHMAVLALDRYLYILHPFVYIRHVTRQTVMAAVAGTWFVGILTSALPSIYFISHPWTPFCEYIDMPTPYTISVGSAYCLIFVTTCFAYFKIFQEARRQKRSIRAGWVVSQPQRRRLTEELKTTRTKPGEIVKFEEEAEFPEPSSLSSIRPTSSIPVSQDENELHRGKVDGEDFRKRDSWKYSVKVVKFLVLVFGISTACTFPCALCIGLNSVVTVPKTIAFIMFSGFAWNSALNLPLIVIRDACFRNELKKLIKEVKECFTCPTQA